MRLPCVRMQACLHRARIRACLLQPRRRPRVLFHLPLRHANMPPALRCGALVWAEMCCPKVAGGLRGYLQSPPATASLAYKLEQGIYGRACATKARV